MKGSAFLLAFRNSWNLIKRHDEDSFDRLSSHVSIGILLSMIAFFLISKATMTSIECFVPSELTQFYRYASSYCLTSQLYHNPPGTKSLPRTIPGQSLAGDWTGVLSYYIWVEVILASLCLPYAVPGFVWEWATNQWGYDAAKMVESTKMYRNSTDGVARLRRSIIFFAKYIDDNLKMQRNQEGASALARAFRGRQLCIAYAFVKVLYIANAVGQLFLLNILLGFDYHSYGADVVQRLVGGENAGPGAMVDEFPLKVICDLNWLELGGPARELVECVMPLNIYHEKIFIFYWYWLVLVATVSLGGLVLYLVRLAASSKIAFVWHRLRPTGPRWMDEDDVRAFVNDYLRPDGVLTLRIVARNASDSALGAELLRCLWVLYENSAARIEPGEQAPNIVAMC